LFTGSRLIMMEAIKINIVSCWDAMHDQFPGSIELSI
jgi:hypothetical protein